MSTWFHANTRSVGEAIALMVAVLTVAAACSGSADTTASDSESVETDAGEADGSSAGSDAPLEEWAASVAALLGDDFNAMMDGEIALIEASMDSGQDIAGFLAQCDVRITQMVEIDASLPAPPTDPLIADVYDAFLAAHQDRTGVFNAACATVAADADAMQAEVTAAMEEFGFPEGTRLLDNQIEIAMAEDAVIEACFALVELIEPMLREPVPCVPTGPLQDADGGTGPGIEEMVNTDLDPLAGPMGPDLFALLDPGEHTFGWFGRPFTITSEVAFVVDSTETGIQFTPLEGVAEVVFQFPSEVADPADPGEWELNATIPLEDFGTWLAALPLATTSDAMTVGGLPATYWAIDFDGPGEALALWDGPIPEYGPIPATRDARLHVWEVEHPDGLLLIWEMESLGDDRWASAAAWFLDLVSF